MAAFPVLCAQGTLGDYERAQQIQEKARSLIVNVPGPATWIGNTGHFWYPLSVHGGTEFVVVDSTVLRKRPAFDHERLAAAISSIAGKKYTALKLPFAPQNERGARATVGNSPLKFADDERSIQFGVEGTMYRCGLLDYVCTKMGPVAEALGAGRAPDPEGPGGDPEDGLEPPAPQQDGSGAGGFNRAARSCGPRPANETQTARRDRGRPGMGSTLAETTEPTEVCASFDGKWEAFIENYNVFVKQVGANEPAFALSTDGSEGNHYTFRTIAWSPDSKKLAAYHTRPGYDRLVHYIESSPADQIQPKHMTIPYRKPGDTLDIAYPALFDVVKRKEIEIDRALFPNAFDITRPTWWKDGRGFTFEYNQRGHQVYRVIEVDAETGKARLLIDEQCKTFFYYNLLGPGLSAGRRFRHDVNDGKEIIWASERDGWEHLYLYDGVTGNVKNQITKGPWVVRNVDYIDDAKRQIWFEAGGMHPDQDPYFTHYYRINFDGSGLKALTQANGTHTVAFSPDRTMYVDRWERVDLPPISELRRTDDGKVLMEIEKGDASALAAMGVKDPEVFVAKGRDGKTDIWGIIIRPTNFDASKKYPVIENIYAGPQGSFVPKTFGAALADQALAELGFNVVHIDGMGTNNRSKAFHDVAWKNLADAGFPDRILWHMAVAAKYPYYDISRVGIFGTSAGGQSALSALLFHGDFYKVAVTNSGCHDNRMDKIWWNEQWMGWPVGPQYAASSNVENAFRLQGKALIIVGELDTNVDPASSLQVVNALIKAHKHFDMLYNPGQNHGVPVLAREHYRDDYFVHNLLGVEPPDWNHVSLPPADAAATAN